ncbi:transcriptional repressor LexA [Candidatus Nitrospira salsa]
MPLNDHFQKIVQFHRTHQRMPSYQEIAQLAKFRSKFAALRLVNRLIENGRLQKDKTGRLLPTRYFHEIPWLGTVVAGWASPADEELLDTVTLDEYLITNKEKTYMLRVQGDSMIDAGILPGDLVLVEWRKEAKSGEIVIAQVDGEWTMKTYRKRGRKVTLEAANTNYEPIVPKDELKIVAVVTAVIRKY